MYDQQSAKCLIQKTNSTHQQHAVLSICWQTFLILDHALFFQAYFSEIQGPGPPTEGPGAPALWGPPLPPPPLPPWGPGGKGVSREYVNPTWSALKRHFFRKKSIIDDLRAQKKHVMNFQIIIAFNLKTNNLLLSHPQIIDYIIFFWRMPFENTSGRVWLTDS